MYLLFFDYHFLFPKIAWQKEKNYQLSNSDCSFHIGYNCDYE